MTKTKSAEQIDKAQMAMAWAELLNLATSRRSLQVMHCGYTGQGKALYAIFAGSELIAPQGTAEEVAAWIVHS